MIQTLQQDLAAVSVVASQEVEPTYLTKPKDEQKNKSAKGATTPGQTVDPSVIELLKDLGLFNKQTAKSSIDKIKIPSNIAI